MNGGMDWERAAFRRLSRRRFLGAAGTMAAAAGLAAAGCGGSSGNTNNNTIPIPGASRERASGAPTASPSRVAISDQHGETLRYSGYVSSDGVWDPHKTQAAPFYGQQALVFSRLLTYQDQVEGAIIPDLAVAMPETPDLTTLIFRLNPAAAWHGRAPMNGRPVTADDVVFSIRRQIDGRHFVRPQGALGGH